MANTNELTIVQPDGETLVVDASTFRTKPANIVRDLAAEYAYDEFLPEFGETLEDRDTIASDVVIDAMLEKASSIRNKHVLQFLARVSEQDALVARASDGDDDAKAKLPKKTERVRFERDLRRYQPTRSRASVYAGQTRAMLKTRISELVSSSLAGGAGVNSGIAGTSIPATTTNSTHHHGGARRPPISHLTTHQRTKASTRWL